MTAARRDCLGRSYVQELIMLRRELEVHDVERIHANTAKWVDAPEVPVDLIARFGKHKKLQAALSARDRSVT
jgi:hypothetical protein